jgi:DNA-binding NarL/FixJ family response regulator
MGSSERRSRPVCMLVEDEALIALALEDGLAEAGYEIAGPFASCADALASLAERVPDVAILDATLKDGSCQEVARELRRLDVTSLVIGVGAQVRAQKLTLYAGGVRAAYLVAEALVLVDKAAAGPRPHPQVARDRGKLHLAGERSRAGSRDGDLNCHRSLRESGLGC